jgi:hypothetical protein
MKKDQTDFESNNEFLMIESVVLNQNIWFILLSKNKNEKLKK